VCPGHFTKEISVFLGGSRTPRFTPAMFAVATSISAVDIVQDAI